MWSVATNNFINHLIPNYTNMVLQRRSSRLELTKLQRTCSDPTSACSRLEYGLLHWVDRAGGTRVTNRVPRRIIKKSQTVVTHTPDVHSFTRTTTAAHPHSHNTSTSTNLSPAHHYDPTTPAHTLFPPMSRHM